jgi:hydrogenase expression/formation protein HypC
MRWSTWPASRKRSRWLDGVAVGDYVIVHVGYALNKLDPEEAEKTLKLFAEMGELAFADENPTLH